MNDKSNVPPQKPNLFRPLAVICTILAAIGTAATIVGGGILISYHDLTVDDYHTRRAAGITTVVVGALLIPPGVLVGLHDAYQYYIWWQWNKQHNTAETAVAAATDTQQNSVATQPDTRIATEAPSQHMEPTAAV